MVVLEVHRRPPSVLERYYLCRGLEKYYSNFNITVQYRSKVTPLTLSSALRAMVSENTWLTHNFYKLDEQDNALVNGLNHEIRIVEKILFEDVVRFESIDVFDGTTIGYLNSFLIPMNVENLPLWKIIVLDDREGHQYVSGLFDHSIFDGMSGVQFMKDLAVQLEKAEDQYEEVIFDYVRESQVLPAVITPPIEAVRDLYLLSYLDIAKYYLSKYLPTFWNFFERFKKLFEKNLFKPDFGVNPIFRAGIVKKDTDTKFRIVNFTNQQVDEVSQFCRVNDMTVTPYFNVIAAKCLQETVFKSVDPGTEFSTLNLIAVNGRRYYPQYKDFLYGVMVCGDPVVLPPISSDLISYMKYFHKCMMENIKSRVSFKLVGLYRFYNFWDFFSLKLNKREGRFSLTISNLGKIVPTNGKFDIENMYFGLNTGVVYHFILNMSTTEKGGLQIVFGSLPEYEELYENEKKVMDIFVDKFQEMVLNYIKK